jgi:hypothetical protein
MPMNQPNALSSITVMQDSQKSETENSEKK